MPYITEDGFPCGPPLLMGKAYSESIPVDRTPLPSPFLNIRSLSESLGPGGDHQSYDPSPADLNHLSLSKDEADLTEVRRGLAT